MTDPIDTAAVRSYAYRYLGHPMTDKMLALCDELDAARAREARVREVAERKYTAAYDLMCDLRDALGMP